MKPLSPAQARALEVLRAQGVLYYGNSHRVSLATARVLAREGFGTLKTSIATRLVRGRHSFGRGGYHRTDHWVDWTLTLNHPNTTT